MVRRHDDDTARGAVRRPRVVLVLGLAAATLGAALSAGHAAAWAATFSWNPFPLESGGLLLVDESQSNLPTFTGTGDSGDTVVVVATDVPNGRDYELCSTRVTVEGTWSCRAVAVPDFTGSLTARVVAGDQAGSAAEPISHAGLNPPRFTNATALGKDYLTREPSAVVMSGTTYDDQSGSGTPPIVTISVPSEGAMCEATVSAGAFTCALSLVSVSDGVYPYTASITTEFGTSLARTGIIVVDTTVDFAVITRPLNGQVIADLTPTLSGTGEPGATVFPLFYPTFQPACTPPIVSAVGTWSCTMSRVDPGTVTLWSYQVDRAGNVGPSTEGSLTFSVVAPPPPERPTAPAPARETPSPTPTTPAMPTPIAEPTPTQPAPPAPEPSDEPLPTPVPAVVGGGGATDPTAFGSSLRSPLDVAQTPPLVVAGAAAGAASFVLFVALPAELLNGAIRENYDRLLPWRGRLRRRTAHGFEVIQGRLGTAGSIALVAVTVGGITTLADPHAGANAATLRLWIALSIALVIVNLAVSATLRVVARRWFAVDLAARILPGALLLCVVSVIASRALAISPGIVFGLILGIALGRELSRAESGRLAAVASCVLLCLGVGAWMLHATVVALGSPNPGFAELLAREALVAITVESLSSLAIALLPIAFMDGRAIWLWSRRVWAPLCAAGILAFVIVIVPMPGSWTETAGPLSTTVIAFAAFGVLSVVIWWALARRASAPSGE